MSLLHVVLFWAAVTAAGLIGLPFAELAFDRLPGRGRVFARPLGLLLVAYPAWLLASVHLVAFGRALVLASLAAGAAASALVWRGRVAGRRDRGHASIWLVGEGVFALAFFGWTRPAQLLPGRLADGEADGHGDHQRRQPERRRSPRTTLGSPGARQLLLLRPLPGRLPGPHRSGVAPAVGYNLAVALFYALTATSVFAVAATLYLARSGARRRAEVSPIARRGRRGRRSRWSSGTSRAASQLLDHPDRIGDVRLVVAVPRDRGHGERVPVLQLPARATCTRT